MENNNEINNGINEDNNYNDKFSFEKSAFERIIILTIGIFLIIIGIYISFGIVLSNLLELYKKPESLKKIRDKIEAVSNLNKFSKSISKKIDYWISLHIRLLKRNIKSNEANINNEEKENKIEYFDISFIITLFFAFIVLSLIATLGIKFIKLGCDILINLVNLKENFKKELLEEIVKEMKKDS